MPQNRIVELLSTLPPQPESISVLVLAVIDEECRLNTRSPPVARAISTARSTALHLAPGDLIIGIGGHRIGSRLISRCVPGSLRQQWTIRLFQNFLMRDDLVYATPDGGKPAEIVIFGDRNPLVYTATLSISHHNPGGGDSILTGRIAGRYDDGSAAAGTVRALINAAYAAGNYDPELGNVATVRLSRETPLL